MHKYKLLGVSFDWQRQQTTSSLRQGNTFLQKEFSQEVRKCLLRPLCACRCISAWQCSCVTQVWITNPVAVTGLTTRLLLESQVIHHVNRDPFIVVKHHRKTVVRGVKIWLSPHMGLPRPGSSANDLNMWHFQILLLLFALPKTAHTLCASFACLIWASFSVDFLKTHAVTFWGFPLNFFFFFNDSLF